MEVLKMNYIDKFFSITIDFDVIGLMRVKEFPRYFCTPIQAAIFASTGVDGIHFCLIRNENDHNFENSPVYVVSPMMPEHYIELVGRSLMDFLSLVITCKDAGALECIAYMSENSFNEYLEESSKNRNEMPIMNDKIEKAILALKSCFELKEIDNVYQHIQETKNNSIYHAEFTFSQEYYDLIG
jgi:hypothetical protein